MKSDQQQHPYHRHQQHQAHHLPHSPPHSPLPSPPHSPNHRTTKQQNHPPPTPPHPHITNPYSSQSASLTTLPATSSSNHNSSFSSLDENSPNEEFYTSLCCFTNLSPQTMEYILYAFHIPTFLFLTFITTSFFSNSSSSTPNFWNFDDTDEVPIASLSNGSTTNSNKEEETSANKTIKAILLSITIWMYAYICIKSGDKMEGVWKYEQKKQRKFMKQKALLEEECEGSGQKTTLSGSQQQLQGDDENEDLKEEWDMNDSVSSNDDSVKHNEVLNEEYERNLSCESLTGNNNSNNKEAKEENENDDYLDNEPRDSHHSSTSIIPTTTPVPSKQKIKKIISPILYYTFFYLSLALSGSILSLHIFTLCDSTTTSTAACKGNSFQMRIQSTSMYILVALPLCATSIYMLLPMTDKSKLLPSIKRNVADVIQGPSGASLYASVDFGFTCLVLFIHPGGGGSKNEAILWCGFIVCCVWIYACFDLCLWLSAVNVRKNERDYRKSLEEERRKRKMRKRRRRRRLGRSDRKEQFLLIDDEDDENEQDQVEEKEDTFQDDETKREEDKKKEEIMAESIVIAGSHNSESAPSSVSPALVWSLSLASINFFFTLLDLAYNGGRGVLGGSTISTINNDLTTSASLYSQNMSITFVTFLLYSALLWVGIITVTSITKVCGLGGITMILVRITYFCFYSDVETVQSARMMISSFWIYVLSFMEVGCVLWYSRNIEIYLVQELQYCSISRRIWDKIVMKFVRDRKKWIEEEIQAAEEEEEGSNYERRLSIGSGGGGDNKGGVVAGSAGRKNWWKRRPSSLELMSYLLNKDEEEEEERIDYPAVDSVAEEFLLEDDEEIKDLSEDIITGSKSAGVVGKEKNAGTMELV